MTDKDQEFMQLVYGFQRKARELGKHGIILEGRYDDNGAFLFEPDCLQEFNEQIGPRYKVVEVNSDG